MSQKVKRALSTRKTQTHSNTSSKKRKLNSGKAATSIRSGNKAKGKQRAFERAIISIPDASGDEHNVSDQDMQFFEENPVASEFLGELDYNGIARSKMETRRLHALSNPPRSILRIDDLPSLEPGSEDTTDWSDALDPSVVVSDEERCERDDTDDHYTPHVSDSDVEQHYERRFRQRRRSLDTDASDKVAKLPIKLADGSILKTGNHIRPQSDSEGEEAKDVNFPVRPQESRVDDVAIGARFGRPAVASVVGAPRTVRMQMAKEQIAGICQDILADPESSLGLLRRLHSFSLAEIVTAQSATPVPNDPIIRRLAITSQLIVFKDIIPGYRIRPITYREKAEKVSQMVSRTREWEQGLVNVYQMYLRALESELKGKTEFSDLALKAMCALLTEATHFNFRTNLMSAVVAQLSKKSWDPSSELCLETLISVFRQDTTGVPSLEVVRLINRMIKERDFNVHPNTLSCLLYLRLRSELGGVRASETTMDKEDCPVRKRESRSKMNRKRAKGKKVEQSHISKKAVKVLKEKKEIEGQMREAEAEVDQEERANTHTETLKLLFVLYFRILKAPSWTPLLASALQGISRYAHLINIDFFKDLLHVIKSLLDRTSQRGAAEASGDTGRSTEPLGDQGCYYQLLCIATAFELLSGQGEALNIDLRDFVNHLYTLIPHVAMHSDIESIPCRSATGINLSIMQPNTAIADLLFRTLSLVFPIGATGSESPLRMAAFAKRLAAACLSFPPATIIQSLEFINNLLIKEPKLHALLSSDSRSVDGMFRPELDDPQLSNPFCSTFWELAHLAITHWDSKVREKAFELSRFDRCNV